MKFYPGMPVIYTGKSNTGFFIPELVGKHGIVKGVTAGGRSLIVLWSGDVFLKINYSDNVEPINLDRKSLPAITIRNGVLL